MKPDLWHFPRTKLAQQIVGMFSSGLSNALVFFAPRRMGKTEFLRKDILPLAKRKGFKVFYFSFLDSDASISKEFTVSLAHFAEKNGILAKTNKLLQRINKISGSAVGLKAEIELRNIKEYHKGMKDIFEQIAKKGKALLLLDEVQMLAKDEHNKLFVAGLRTALDMHKGSLKVIFTGSSRQGLRAMFSKADAPFFHFGQNLPFPDFEKDFTDHLALAFNKATKRKLHKNELWNAFEEMNKVPQLIRSLVERLALNPDLTMEDAKTLILADVAEDREYVKIWNNCSALEQLLLEAIAGGELSVFAEVTRKQFAKQLGVNIVPNSSVQSSIRVLKRRQLIGNLLDRKGYFIDDPNFQGWLLNQKH